MALHHQIAVAANRGGGLHIGRQSQAEVGGRLGAHQPTAEAALNSGEAHGPLGQGLELSGRWQVCRRLAAIGQGQALLDAEAGGDGPGEHHRLGHQLA